MGYRPLIRKCDCCGRMRRDRGTAGTDTRCEACKRWVTDQALAAERAVLAAVEARLFEERRRIAAAQWAEVSPYDGAGRMSLIRIVTFGGEVAAKCFATHWTIGSDQARARLLVPLQRVVNLLAARPGDHVDVDTKTSEGRFIGEMGWLDAKAAETPGFVEVSFGVNKIIRLDDAAEG